MPCKSATCAARLPVTHWSDTRWSRSPGSGSDTAPLLRDTRPSASCGLLRDQILVLRDTALTTTTAAAAVTVPCAVCRSRTMVTESELRPRQSAGAECPSVGARCGLELETNFREVYNYGKGHY